MSYNRSSTYRSARYFILLWSAVSVIPVLLTSCSLFERDPVQRTLQGEYDQTFEIVRKTLGSQFTLKTVDKKEGRIATEWQIIPSDVKSKRVRFVANIRRADESPNSVNVSIRSYQQEVERSFNTYKTDKAEWDSIEPDREREKDLLAIIHFKMNSEQRKKAILEKAEKSEKREQRLKEIEEEGY